MQDLRSGGKEAYRRQLAAADSASALSIVTNCLGVPARLELDHGNHTCAFTSSRSSQIAVTRSGFVVTVLT